MHYIAYLSLPGFYSRSCQAHLRDDPWALYHEGRILESNTAAAECGIAPGIGLREAKTLAPRPGCLFELKLEQFERDQHAWLDHCAWASDAIEPSLPHEAWIDLSDHPDPFHPIESLTARLANLGYDRLVVGCSQGKWLAQLAARPWSAAWKEEAAGWLDRPSSQLVHRSIHDLTPIREEHRSRLQFLGYRRIGEVAALPVRVLRQQFGAEAWRISDAAHARLADPIRRLYPYRRAIAGVQLAGAETEEAIDAALQRIANRLARSLHRVDSVASSLAIALELENGAQIERERLFAKPLARDRDLFRGLQQLSYPIGSPVNSIQAVLSRLEPAVRKQGVLEQCTDRAERHLAASAAFRSLRTAYGEEAVQVAGEIEPPRRVRLLRAWKDATGWQ